jgi:uncharacterized 2Fe-2S/4Fe-4S cluster protein (DUF4445 family)
VTLKRLFLTVLPSCRVFPVEEGTLLSEALIQAGFAIPLPCGGHGICGKCGVCVMGRNGQSRVSACQTRVTESLTVSLPLSVSPSPVVKAVRIPVSGNLGCAVDLGTTSIAVSLWALDAKACLGTIQFENPQRCCGDDVLSRISAIQQDSGRLSFLRDIAQTAIGAAAGELCRVCGVDVSRVVRYALAGNTVMQQIFLGISPVDLGRAPFLPAFHEARTCPLAKTFLPGAKDGTLYVFPQIGGFVGGDTVAGLLVTCERGLRGRTLFVDLGTNAEIALMDGANVTVTSAAAGPAIEGATLTCGMTAGPGAVCAARLNPSGRLVLGTVGGGEPRGICGSGFIDILAALVEGGVIQGDGAFTGGEAEYAVASGIRLTQTDVRKFQLAKGAICAGIRVLLRETGTAPESVRSLVVAGGLGQAVRFESASRLGLFPELPAAEYVALGNSSLAGAERVLIEPDAAERAEDVRKAARAFNLASVGQFDTLFIQQLGFPQ